MKLCANLFLIHEYTSIDFTVQDFHSCLILWYKWFHPNFRNYGTYKWMKSVTVIIQSIVHKYFTCHFVFLFQHVCRCIRGMEVREDMDVEGRLPLGDIRRQEARDQKLLFREEMVADRTMAARRVCPCNVCLGENRSLRYRAIVRQHLQTYGRHPSRRGSTQVTGSLESNFVMFAPIFHTPMPSSLLQFQTETPIS